MFEESNSPLIENISSFKSLGQTICRPDKVILIISIETKSSTSLYPADRSSARVTERSCKNNIKSFEFFKYIKK